MQRRFILTTAALIALIAGGSRTAQADTFMTRQFVMKASMSDMFEIETSRLALKKSNDPKVKEFAQKMINDHMKASEKLKYKVSDNTMEMNSLSHGLDADHMMKLQKLKHDSASAFDADYIKCQVMAHKDAVMLFNDYSMQGPDTVLQNYAAMTLPTLKEHLMMAKEINRSM